MIVVSGQVPLDADGTLVGKDDPEAQIDQVFRNLVAALASAGAGMENVVKFTIFLTDLADLPVFRTVRDRYLSPAGSRRVHWSRSAGWCTRTSGSRSRCWPRSAPDRGSSARNRCP